MTTPTTNQQVDLGAYHFTLAFGEGTDADTFWTFFDHLLGDGMGGYIVAVNGVDVQVTDLRGDDYGIDSIGIGGWLLDEDSEITDEVRFFPVDEIETLLIY